MKHLRTPDKSRISALCLTLFVSACIIFLMPSCGTASIKKDSAPNLAKSHQSLPESKKPPAQTTIQEEKQSSGLRIVGYLPAGLLASSGQDFDQNIRALTDAIINTAVYWDENGDIKTTEEFAPAMEKWNSLSLHEQLRWCTINPKGAMIRSSTAGQTIDTPEKRTALAEKILEFCKENNFDGVDIDWEFPLENEWADFGRFIITLQQLLEADSRQLSLAFYPKEIVLSPQAIEAIDRVNIMAYDQFDENGYHSTYQTSQQSVEYFTALGFKPGKLCLGIPFYGRPTDKSSKWPFYSEAAGKLQDDDNISGDIFYNGRELSRKKTALAKEKQLCGVMLYHIYCDLPAQDNASLTNIIKQAAQS